MKRILYIIMLTIFSLSLVGCDLLGISTKTQEVSTSTESITSLTDEPTTKETDVPTDKPTDAPTDNPTTTHVHVWNDGVVTLEPTCTSKGVRTFTCECGETREEDIDALGHNLIDDPAVEATCTTSGKEAGKHCTRCDYTEGLTTIEAL